MLRLAPGLMRLNNSGEIVQCNYNFDTKRMGWLQFEIPEVYTQRYAQGYSRWSVHDLWKAVTSQPYAIGALIVNNSILTTVFKDGLDEVSRNKVVQRSTTVTRLFHPILQSGYVRTVPRVKDVTVPPYGLFMDRRKRVSLCGRPAIELKDAVATKDISLYKQLIGTDHYAIYMTAEGPKYLDL